MFGCLHMQYEVNMPLSTMADCWSGLLQLLYGNDTDGTATNAQAAG